MRTLEYVTGKRFGGAGDPLLVSIRTSCRASMPGLMDTILNLGLNDETVVALAAATHNERFAWDCYRRFIQMYGDIVMDVQKRKREDHEPFEVVIHGLKHERYHEDIEDTMLNVDDLKELVARFKSLIKKRTGNAFPQNPWDQLLRSVSAACNSWNNQRTATYRRKYGIPDNWGIAVVVQSMVFGNASGDSGTGVAFTRNPATGANELYGEYLTDAQGEDVVAGIRTPKPVMQMAAELPRIFRQLLELRRQLERYSNDMQDFEFTFERGRLYLLQSRNGKRTTMASINIAVDMVESSLISRATALRRVRADGLSELFAPIFEPDAERKAVTIAVGLPAGPGVASGRLYLSSERAQLAASRGQKVVLVRTDVSPEDLPGMIAAEGVLTTRGGVSSHAALVARQMGKVCVAGAFGVQIDYTSKTIAAGDIELKEGDFISINGTNGNVYAGEIKTISALIVQALIEGSAAASRTSAYLNFKKIMDWADETRVLAVRANADSPEQVANAIALGAEGIGLCRTENMFFENGRMETLQAMLLAEDATRRSCALGNLRPYQQQDFERMFEALQGRPITIRLLDIRTHELLRDLQGREEEIAARLQMTASEITHRLQQLRELNPTLGMRGCRFSTVHPEVTDMQAEAIFRAMLVARSKTGQWPNVEILVPFAAFAEEARSQKDTVEEAAERIRIETGQSPPFRFGTLIEVPRAALVANDLAKHSDFLAFEENDLTQTTLGFSRDDSASFIPAYMEAEILRKNPFAAIDENGLGSLMVMAIERARSTKNDLVVGSCGEQAGDPDSVHFLHRAGLSWISCSPFRLPTAKIAAAQAVLAEKP